MGSEADSANSGHWSEVEALFQALADCEPAQRMQQLQALAGEYSPEALAEVRGLLGSLERHESLFSAPAAAGLALEREYAVGSRLGRWEVIGTLGRGGQGLILHVARRDGGFEQRGVLKTLRDQSTAPDALRRLLRERQLLAELDHPALPAVLDGGLLDDGAPFFVLEFVAGIAIDAHAQRQQLDPAARVALLRQVAAVVAHAHGRLVLHRDLKPGNVLVTAEGRVVLLDFGVAQTLDAGRTHTVAGFTPAFAAPEQIRGQRSGVATDVWGLGATGFAVLCDAPPFAAATGATVEAVLHAAPAFPAGLDADLAAILGKALRKEPEARYPSIEALDADLARWQRGEAVLARAGGRRYRAGKWLRRHRGAVFAGLALAFSLSVGLLLSLQQRAEALAAQHRAETTLDLLVELFSGSLRETGVGETSVRRFEPDADHGLETSVRSVLDRATRKGHLDGLEPELRLPLQRAFGEVYASLGARDSAIEQYRAALQIDVDDTAAALGLAHLLLQNAGEVPEEAFALLNRLLQRGLPQVTALRLIDRGCDALRRMQRLDEAEALLRRGFALYGLDPQAAAAPLPPAGDTAVWHSFLYLQRARLALARGDNAAASRDLDATLAYQESGNGSGHISLVRVLQTRSELRREQGEATAALEDILRAEAIVQASRPDDHATAGRLLTVRGILLRQLGQLSEADQAYAAALARYAQLEGRDTTGIRLQIQRNRANLSMDAGEYAAAAARYAELLAETRSALGPAHRMSLENQLSLARARHGEGEHRQALDDFQALLLLDDRLPEALRRQAACGAAHAAVALGEVAAASEHMAACEALRSDPLDLLEQAEHALVRSLLRRANNLAPRPDDLEALRNASRAGIPPRRRLFLDAQQLALVCGDCR